MNAKWLSDQLDTSGRSQADLARHLGLAAPIINKMVKGKRLIKSEEADEILRFFGIEAANTSARSSADRSHPRDVRKADVELSQSDVASWPKDIPIYGTALGGSSGGGFTMNGDSGLRVGRPPKLIGRTDIIALHVEGDSMAERYMPSELILLEKLRPPQNGDFVVVELKPGRDGEQEAFLKQLIGRTPTKLRLRQLNPEKIIEIEHSKVLQILRVIPLMDLIY